MNANHFLILPQEWAYDRYLCSSDGKQSRLQVRVPSPTQRKPEPTNDPDVPENRLPRYPIYLHLCRIPLSLRSSVRRPCWKKTIVRAYDGILELDRRGLEDEEVEEEPKALVNGMLLAGRGDVGCHPVEETGDGECGVELSV